MIDSLILNSPLPPTIMAIILLIFGMILLIKGGDWTVESAASMGRYWGVSPLLIGFTVIAFGTSLPELFVSVAANFNDAAGLAIGNVIGSNIANILLIVGVSAIIYPVIVQRHKVKRDLYFMIFATALLIAIMPTGVFTRWQGFLMLVILIAYVTWQYRSSKVADIDASEDKEEVLEFGTDVSNMKLVVLFLALGLFAIAFGAKILVSGATFIAAKMGVPDAVIGITIVAFGTSLPELATCYSAARKRHTELIIGNIVGSNVFNILSIIGITSLIKPLEVSKDMMGIDIIVLSVVTVGFSFYLLGYGKIGKKAGSFMLAVYLLYMGFQFIGKSQIDDALLDVIAIDAKAGVDAETGTGIEIETEE